MLRRIMSIFTAVICVLSMTACDGEQIINTDIGGLIPGEEINKKDNSDVNVSLKEISTEYRPVLAEEDTFIVKDEVTEHYGLIDGKGKEIMPCEYGDMYYLKVNSFPLRGMWLFRIKALMVYMIYREMKLWHLFMMKLLKTLIIQTAL